MKGKPFPKFYDYCWMCDVAFYTDIAEHVNKLNINLQERVTLSQSDKITAFQKSCELAGLQLRSNNITHFPIKTTKNHTFPEKTAEEI